MQNLDLGLSLEQKPEEVSKLSRDCCGMMQHFLRRDVIVPADCKVVAKAAKKKEEADMIEVVVERTGEAAFRVLLKQVQEGIERGTAIADQDLEDLQRFLYLAAADIEDTAKECLKQLAAKSGPSAPKKAKSVAASSSTAGSSSAQLKKDAAKNAARAMFS